MCARGWRTTSIPPGGKLAKSNTQMAAKVRRILEELGHEIATPDEARALLATKGADKVAF